jgi:hypothetical protein
MSVAAELPAEIKPWELHSELVLVCPDVWRRALELLPERDPYAFLVPPRRPAAEPMLPHGLPAGVLGHALRRLVDTARIGLVTIGGLAALASLAEALH